MTALNAIQGDGPAVGPAWDYNNSQINIWM